MRITNLLLTGQGEGQGLAGPLPKQLKSKWCVVTLPLPRTGAEIRAVIALDLDGGTVITRFTTPGRLGRRRGLRSLLYMPAEAVDLRVELFGIGERPDTLTASVRPVSRTLAGAFVIARHPMRVLRAALSGRAGWRRRVRAAVSALACGDRVPQSYAMWSMLFDHWSDHDRQRLLVSPNRSNWPRMLALVVTPGAGHSEAEGATLASLEHQIAPARVQVMAPGCAFADQLQPRDDYLAVLQAGEELPAHALALFAEWIVRHDQPPALCADEDEVGADGARVQPLFKPEPNRTLMIGGVLTRGVWLFRRDLLAQHAAATDGPAYRWAETLRLDLWLRLYEAGLASSTLRVPFVLTHRRPSTEAAPPAALAQVVQAHLARVGQQARIDAAHLPLRVSPVLPASKRQRVSLIVPSACRAAHVRRCLGAVLAGTDHPALDLSIVVSQLGPLDAAQTATCDALGSDPRLRVLIPAVDAFNYSRANNYAAAKTDAEFLCLLNDDVAPMSPDWLSLMLGHFADPAVGAVGAKLCYENGSVQHGGIVMGIGGLADHINRLLPRDDPGYGHRAVLNQELSAVTGACLLVRRELYEAVGGLDESFPIAFNDVDFCLKVRAAGRSVVFCADAKLIHYESLSLGHHFSGERSGLERIEVQRMRARWPQAVAADPFHNPNLSLTRGHEWDLAFPPRVRKADILPPEPALMMSDGDAAMSALDAPAVLGAELQKALGEPIAALDPRPPRLA